jgi:hypothetical protein
MGTAMNSTKAKSNSMKIDLFTLTNKKRSMVLGIPNDHMFTLPLSCLPKKLTKEGYTKMRIGNLKFLRGTSRMKKKCGGHVKRVGGPKTREHLLIVLKGGNLQHLRTSLQTRAIPAKSNV